MQRIQMVKQWTQEEDDYIRLNYLSMTDDEIGEHIGRSSSAVKNERGKLKLYRPYVKRNPIQKRPPLSFQDIIEMFDKKNYQLLSSSDEYKNKASKLRYICPKHKDKGAQTISVCHLQEGKGCCYCGRERTAESKRSKVTPEEDELLCSIKGFEYVNTQTENGKAYIFFICPKHRNLGVQKMKRGNMNRDSVHGCQYCNGKNYPYWYVKETIESRYPNLTVISEYEGMNKQLSCYCSVHNTTFSNTAKEIFYYGRGCDGCSHDTRANIQKLSDEEVVAKALALNNNISVLDVSNYKNYNSNIHVRCNKCGHEWDASLSDLHNQNGHCPNCYVRANTSLGESTIAQWLSDNNVPFFPQYTIKECRNINPLPFDFGIFNSDMSLIALIEYQGRQHYEAIDYFGGEPKFEMRKKCDKIKKDYCANHNIPLLIIPYWDFDNIHVILSNFIKTIQ